MSNKELTNAEIISIFESEIRNNAEAYLSSNEIVYQITASELISVYHKFFNEQLKDTK